MFLMLFPNALGARRTSLNEIPLDYYLTSSVFHRSIEQFDSRKTKIHDDVYSSLFDKFITEWNLCVELKPYDRQVILSPKKNQGPKMLSFAKEIEAEAPSDSDFPDDDSEEGYVPTRQKVRTIPTVASAT
jgi:hypothetical protein